MYFLIYGLIGAVVMFAGLSFCGIKRLGFKLFFTLAAFVAVGLVGWLIMPVAAWNFEHNWLLLFGLCVAVIFICFAADPDEGVPWRAFLPAFIVFLMFPVGLATTWSAFHADAYHRLLGEPVVSDFSADVSPVSIDQVRRVDQELAHTLGSKRIEELPGLGSRVSLSTMNIQTLDGCFGTLDGNNVEHELCFENELVWAGPLVHSGVLKWWSNGTTPGYVLVSATDPTKVHLVTALKASSPADTTTVARMGGGDAKPDGYEPIRLRYFDTGGYFGDYVVRHVRTNGYSSTGLADYSFEVDNSGRPHWVITRYERTIGFGGADARGVVVVDLQTGATADYDIAEAPDWIDRIQPEPFITSQLDAWGAHVHGWWNKYFGKQDIVKMTPGVSLVVGSDDRKYWYSGLQSAGADTSTNSFVLVDVRTKEVRRYMISGANEEAARNSAQNAPGAVEAGYVGINPILYNVNGTPTYFVPLKDAEGLVKMFGFVSVRNYETVGVGQSVPAALRAYQNALIREGQGVKVQDLATEDRIEATVLDVVQINETFYLRLEGQEGYEFYGTSDVSPELKWTTPGETVVVFIQRGELRSLQMIAFDIPSLSISHLQNGS